MEYQVEWAIDVDAESPQDAALQCLKMQRDPDSTATIFDVWTPDGERTRVEIDRGTARIIG